ncbi:MAG: response regulator, partial [Bacteroidota bacterium]
PSPVPISVFGGVGSDFWFEIPLEVDTTQRSIEDLTMEVTPTDTHKLQQPVRVLVAEDNALNQLLFETFLTEMGAKVVLCKNGADAVETLRKDLRFDLVLMDVQMPVLDGLGASRKIREEISGTLPIIGCTAGAFPEDIEQCHQAGMNDFLPKPFRQKDLFEKVTHWVPELKTL